MNYTVIYKGVAAMTSSYPTRGGTYANTLGAALGRLAKLGNSVRTGKQFCPNPTEVHRIAPVNGHGVKLVGETGEV